MNRKVTANGQISDGTTASCPAIALMTQRMARRAVFVGAALAATALPVNIADNSGWITVKSALASHDKSNDSGPGHGGNNGGGGNSGGAGDPGGGGSGGAGVPGGGDSSGGAGGGGGPNDDSGGGGRNSGDSADNNQRESKLESLVEDDHEDRRMPDDADAGVQGAGPGVPAVTAVIGAAGVRTLTADEELAMIAAGWN